MSSNNCNRASSSETKESSTECLKYKVNSKGRLSYNDPVWVESKVSGEEAENESKKECRQVGNGRSGVHDERQHTIEKKMEWSGVEWSLVDARSS